MKIREGFIELVLSSFFWGTIGIVDQISYSIGGSVFSIVFIRSLISTFLCIPLVDFRKIINIRALLLGIITSIFYEIYLITIPIDGPS
ncbi:hypothetical protein HLB03_11785, partial [Acidianus sp. DSM 29099]